MIAAVSSLPVAIYEHFRRPPNQGASAKTKNETPADIDDKDISQWRTIYILYFGALVDQIERDREEVKIPPSVTTVQALVDWLAERGTHWDTAIRKNPVKVTINRQFAENISRIAEGDEVAFVPIVPGSQ